MKYLSLRPRESDVPTEAVTLLAPPRREQAPLGETSVTDRGRSDIAKPAPLPRGVRRVARCASPPIFLVTVVTAAIFTIPALSLSRPAFYHHYLPDPVRASHVVAGAPPAAAPRFNVITQVGIPSIAVLAQALVPGSITGSGQHWVVKRPIVIAAGASLDVRQQASLTFAPGSYLEVGPGGAASLENLSITATPSATERGFIFAVGGRLVLRHDRLSSLGRLAALAYGVSFAGATHGSGVFDSIISNDTVGVYATSTSGLVISGDRIFGSALDGIELHGQVTGARVTQDLVVRSGLHDVVLGAGVTGAIISHNDVEYAREHGILLYNGATRDTVSSNLLVGCLDGIVLTSAGHNLLQGNLVRSARRFGLRVTGTSSADAILGNSFDGSAIGVYLLRGAHGNRLIGNRFALNGENVRIRMSAPSNVVRPVPSSSELWSQ